MGVCRTLDYIVNTDLHLFLFVKFDYARSKGIQIEIELTEPITHLPIDSKEYIEVIDLVLDNAFKMIMESTEKKLNFYMFHIDKELHLVLKCSASKEYSDRVLEKALKKHKNIYFYTTNEKSLIRQHLIVK